MKLKIATNSTKKLCGITNAFSRFFGIQETEIEVSHQSVDSGVPNQPFNEETYQGALNRVQALLNSEDSCNYDYYVACEAGIEKFMGLYFNVQVVCIYEKKTNKFFYGKSSGWQIPSEAIEIIKQTNLDDYLKNNGITEIRQLLGNSRAELVSQATQVALASAKLQKSKTN